MMRRTKPDIKNRRAHTRHQFATALRYRGWRQDTVLCSGSGRTIDMSAGGITLDLGRALEPGAELEMALEWPGIYHDRPRMRLYVWAEVLRSTPESTAVRILTHEFQDAAAARAVA
ncbi:MAG: PilZ domain-containing protein [Acidobacteriota bacterium]|nr:PilZ domain-containing protein [Acidobacteriota bacterium]